MCPAAAFYDVKDPPSLMTACAFSGNYDAAADQAYRAINMWMSTHGFSFAGVKREIYPDGMLEFSFR
jgi:hypothetical protein